jgi:hypothetical protein
MTKDQMIVDLAFRSKVLLWSCIALGSLSIGVLGYAVVRYNSFSVVEHYALDMFFSYNVQFSIFLLKLDVPFYFTCIQSSMIIIMFLLSFFFVLCHLNFISLN